MTHSNYPVLDRIEAELQNIPVVAELHMAEEKKQWILSVAEERELAARRHFPRTPFY